MSHIDLPSRRHFTDAARAAAMAKRRHMALFPKDKAAPELFVVRLDLPSMLFGWETRRYGSIVLSRSPGGYVTIAGARAAGEVANPGLAQIQPA